MDSRAALKAGTTLRFNDGWEYTITDELARGGSSLVYNAYYIDNLGTKKNCKNQGMLPLQMQFTKIVGWKSADPGDRAEAIRADKAEDAAGLSTGQ